MAEEKKAKDRFPDFEYRLFPIVFKETEMEGIQGPVYRPSGEIMHLDKTQTIEISEGGEVFHDGDAKVYEISDKQFDLESANREVIGHIPCPACNTPIPITTNERPIRIRCPKCGKKGKIE